VPPDQVLLAVLGLAVLTNVALVGVIQLQAVRRRRATRLPGDGGTPRPRVAQTADDEDARAAAAIEAFLSGEAVEPPAVEPPAPPPREAASQMPAATAHPAKPGNRRRKSAPVSLADLETWERTLGTESERAARFGGSITIVLAEISRLHGLADRLGQGVADQVVSEVGRQMASETRAADVIAALGESRFGVLLVETDETNAIAYVNRVRAVVDGWLENAGLTLSLSIGWASPPEGAQASAAVDIAQQRMREAARG
jgi:diguanylate cyclase (GGDEF)-like protein